MIRAEYPRPNFRRSRWMTLNGEWEFGTGTRPSFDRQIVVPFCPESKLSGLHELPRDVVWYRRRFDAPAADRLVLHFGAVDYRATIWVNDVEVARHEGGHVPFTADITEMSRARDNQLVVRAEDPLTDKTIPRGKQYWGPGPEGIFYTPTTGIWQPVWLGPLPDRHITGIRVRPDFSEGAVHFGVGGEGGIELVARLDGEVVGTWSGRPGDGRMQLDAVAPWSPDSPVLYDLEIRLLGLDGGEADRVESYFGMRKIETRDGQLLLNGQPYVQRLVLDQGYYPGGRMERAGETRPRPSVDRGLGGRQRELRPRPHRSLCPCSVPGRPVPPDARPRWHAAGDLQRWLGAHAERHVHGSRLHAAGPARAALPRPRCRP